MSARQFSYYSNWETETLTCPQCGWQGTFNEGDTELYEELMDSSCRQCDEAPMLAIVSYPTLEEMEANFDKLSPAEQQSLKKRKAFLKRLDAEELKPDSPLPDLPGDTLVLFWDWERDDSNDSGLTVIRHGATVLWREPCVWEGYDRYFDVLAILKQRYGSRLHDLIPTTGTHTYLYGDAISSPEKVDAARGELRASSNHPTDKIFEA